MSDYKNTNLVVQANSLIQQTNWDLNAVPLKIFKALISCIDTKNPPKNNIVTISKKELWTLVGSESDGGYDFLKKRIRELQKTSIKIVDNDKIEVYVSLVNKILWEKNTDIIQCRFDEDILPYLVELKERFTQYPVANLTAFGSKYGLILYEWLKAEGYKTMDRDQNIIEIDDLRRLTGTSKKYSKWVNFEAKVLKAAVNDINDSSLEFLVSYDKVKVGRSITAIRFKTRPRQSYKEKTFDQPSFF